MDVEVVEDDYVAGFEGWRQLRGHIGIKGCAIHGAMDDPRSDEFVTSQTCHEGLRTPFAERRLCPQSLATPTAPAQRRHVGLHARFIDEDEPCRLTAHEGLAAFAPLTPRRLDVTTFLLRRQKRFFYM